MTVGIGEQGEAVKGGNAAVHGRIGGQAGFKGEDLAAQIAEAVFQRVKAGLGAEDREPRCPDVRRHKEAVRRVFKEDG